MSFQQDNLSGSFGAMGPSSVDMPLAQTSEDIGTSHTGYFDILQTARIGQDSDSHKRGALKR